MEETLPGENVEEDHGEADAREAGLVRDDFPELDEALDPELDPEFDVENDPELEKRDLHEVDAALAEEEVSG